MAQHESPVEIVTRFTRTAPVDVKGLAQALGADIQYKMLPDTISGKVECELGGGPCSITVNALHSPTRQRFTIAHEIAHIVLHRDLIGDGITDDGMYRSGKSQSIEYAANRYAASILMPWELVVEKVKQGVTNAAGLSRAFGVSSAVAEIRMKELQVFF